MQTLLRLGSRLLSHRLLYYYKNSVCSRAFFGIWFIRQRQQGTPKDCHVPTNLYTVTYQKEKPMFTTEKITVLPGFVYTVNLKSTFMPKMWENGRWIKQDGTVPVTKELEMFHDSFFPLPLNWAWRHNSTNFQAVLSTCTANEASCVPEISNWKHFASAFCPMISYHSACQLEHFSRDCRPASSLQTAVSGTSYKTQKTKRNTVYQMTQLTRYTLMEHVELMEHILRGTNIFFSTRWNSQSRA